MKVKFAAGLVRNGGHECHIMNEEDLQLSTVDHPHLLPSIKNTFKDSCGYTKGLEIKDK